MTLAVERSSEAFRGQMLVLVSALGFSTAGFFTRAAPVELWSMVFWRNLFGGLALLPVLLATSPNALRELAAYKPREGAAIAITAVATICYLASFVFTSVAHVSIIYATAPIVAAALAWGLNGERMSARTLTAALIALAGVAVTVGGSAGGTTFGDALSLVMTVLFALVTVVARGSVRIIPTAIASSLFTALLVLPLGWANGSDFVIGWRDAAWLAGFGIVAMAIALPCYLFGVARVPAGRAMLIGAAEMPLAPLWVWLAFGEAPGLSTVLGGALVAAAILFDLRGPRRPPMPRTSWPSAPD